MRKKRGKLPILPVLVFAAAALLLLFSCGLIMLLLMNLEPSGNGSPKGNALPDSPEDGKNGDITLNTSSSNISSEDMSLWESITIGNVQQACLMKAREEAGESAALVYSCTCEESSTALIKGYECEIRTADPFMEYFADIDCSLMARSCSVTTNFGTTNVSFEELRAYYE